LAHARKINSKNAQARKSAPSSLGWNLRIKCIGGEVYGSDGKLKSEEKGTKRTGTWRIQKDRLCTDYGKEVGSSCYDVWMSGKNVELRTPVLRGPPLEGVLERPR
jgi:hypothetical protein